MKIFTSYHGLKGSSALSRIATGFVNNSTNEGLLDGATYKSKSFLSGGGVGRNVAEGLYKLHGNVHLISAIGNDESGNSLKSYLPATATVGVIKDAKNATSICAVICDKLGDCKLVLGDMKIHSSITPELIMENEQTMSCAPLIIMDANIEVDTMEAVLTVAGKHQKPVFFEPTDMRIAHKPFTLDKSLTTQIKFISPNIYELQKIFQALKPDFDCIQIDTSSEVATLKTAKILLEQINDHFDIIIVTLGPLGVLIANKSSSKVAFDEKKHYVFQKGDVKYHHYRAPKLNGIVNVSGAGDSFTSGFITAMLKGAKEENCVAFGFRAAQCALMAESAVPENYFSCKDEEEEWFKLTTTPEVL